MTAPESSSARPAPHSPWARTVKIVLLFAILVGGGVFLARELIHAPAGLVDKTGDLLEKGGRQLRDVASAFQQGTVRTEFASQAVEMAGATRFQFATLKQTEIFQREESGSTAWGWIPLPKVVVQAQAPVEYGYYLDFDATWQFERLGDTVVVFAPPITPNTPAMDVSALTFHTLEGSLWRDETAVKEKLRQSLTDSLKQRAGQNTTLVRELGRQRLADFVQHWLTEKFSDGHAFHVKVVFPEEREPLPETKAP